MDIGCGTGIWSIDFAKQHPEAQVHGFDLEKSPGWSSAPPNCKLQVANLEEAATWSNFNETFEFIYGRMIVVSVKDWPLLLQRCFSALNPGGWIELQDLQMPIRCAHEYIEGSSKLVQWSYLMIDGMLKFGLSPLAMGNIPKLMAGVGFRSVAEEDYKIFSGPWSIVGEERELGRIGKTNFELSVQGFSSTLFTRGLGWSAERHEALVQDVLQELREGVFKTFLPMKVDFAQKP